MSATESLSSGQFPRLFHGTIHDLEGDTLTPDRRMGASGAQDEWRHLGQSNKDYVSATDDEAKAWNFAYAASGQRLGSGGRPRVYEVEPHPDTKIGIEHLDHPVLKQAFAERWWKKPQPNGEHVAPSYRVIAQHDMAPGEQGTFPSIDWRQHAVGRGKPFANHEQPKGPREPSGIDLLNQRKEKNADRLALHDSMQKLPGLDLPTKKMRFDL